MPREPGVQMADPAADHGGPAAGPGRLLLSLLGRAASGLSFEQESFCRKRFPSRRRHCAAAIRHTSAALRISGVRAWPARSVDARPHGQNVVPSEPSRAAGTRSARRRCHSAIVSTRERSAGLSGLPVGCACSAAGIR